MERNAGFRWPAEWRDSDAMAYLISDFSSSSLRPARKLAFWSGLVCRVCGYRGTPVVGLTELRGCLAWRGVAPMCLEGVLEDMTRKKTVVPLDKLTVTWSQWGLGLLASPFTSVWRRIVPDTSEQKFVVMSVLQDCRRSLLEEVHSTSDSLLYTAQEWTELCRRHVHTSNTPYLGSYLTYSGDIAQYGDPVSLVKVRGLSQRRVDPVDQVDIAIGKAITTRNLLASRVTTLTSKVDELLRLAKQARNRNEALGHLRRKKLYERSLNKWNGALSNTESLLLQLYDSQSQKTVISTLRVGADALHQNKISLSEVDNIMDKLDEYREYEEELSAATASLPSSSSSCPDDEELERELRDLLEPSPDNSSSRAALDNSTSPSKRTVEVIDLTREGSCSPDGETALTAQEVAELQSIEEQLAACPAPAKEVPPSRWSAGSPHNTSFEAEEHPVERESLPRPIKERLSPELRRKPGRKLVGTLMTE